MVDNNNKSFARVLQQWEHDMSTMRNDSYKLNDNNVNDNYVKRWLQNVRSNAERWGRDRIPSDIKKATNETEDVLAKGGDFISPIFRSSIPKLVNARCEHIHSQKTSTFLHYYKARNNNRQVGQGVPENNMVGFTRNRNKLELVEITYRQLDGTHFTIRTQTIEAGRGWQTFIINVWSNLEIAARANETQKSQFYREILNFLNEYKVKFGDGFFPQSLRDAIHEIQDHFNEPRTVFLPTVWFSHDHLCGSFL